MFDMQNLQGMMEQAEKMQKEVKDRMARMAVEGFAGGDSVRVVVNGHKELTKLDISPSAVKNPDLLADLILAAAASAYAKVDAEVGNQIPSALSGMMNGVDLSKIMDMFRK